MPIREYECKSCGKVIEFLESFSEAPKTIHTFCGGELKRLLSLCAPPEFKGKGFFSTDYKTSKSEPNISDA
ncbi:zinc ribbon domain-containing protein [Candidatus Daviesbacteria bacterium]|nr:zinc ribbon domain-containing protein [Candidatus Daviesbacteria bacterium]